MRALSELRRFSSSVSCFHLERGEGERVCGRERAPSSFRMLSRRFSPGAEHLQLVLSISDGVRPLGDLLSVRLSAVLHILVSESKLR